MAKEKNRGMSRSSVRVGNISNVGGAVNIAAGDITTSQKTTGLSAAEIKHLFDQLYSDIEASSRIPPATREDVKAEVKDIQAAVTEAARKKQPVDDGFLARRFRNIARMAPDILDVVVATLGSPLAGLGVAAKKIADKAKADTSLA